MNLRAISVPSKGLNLCGSHIYVVIALNITLSVSGEEEQIVKENPHIKWTEIARRAIREEAVKFKKMGLLSKYLEKKPISRAEYDLMEKMDWHPVDEMRIRPDFAASILKSSKQKTKRIESITEI